MLYGLDVEGQPDLYIKVLILIFLENALRQEMGVLNASEGLS